MTQTAGAPGRLERRKARTRAAIVASATRLFHEQGYEQTSIQQIAEAADTGVGTLYGYFASKEDILREVLRQARNEALGKYFATVDERTPAIERVCRALDSLAEYLRSNRRILVAMFQVAARNRPVDEEQAVWLYNQFWELLTEGIGRGELRRVPVDATVRMLVTTYMTATLGIGPWQGREDDPELRSDLETLTRGLLEKR